jgi:hypothetical protein
MVMGTSARAQYRGPAAPGKYYGPAAPGTYTPTVRYPQYPAMTPPATRAPAAGRARAGYCNYYGGGGHIRLARVRVLGFSDGATAEQVFQEVMEAIGIPARSITVQPADDEPNAAAIMDPYGRTRLIRYNPAFLATIRSRAGTNWTVYAVISHEVAHLLIGHTLEPGGGRPDMEIEADIYSGRVLYDLHATLDEALSAARTLPDGEGSDTHPPKRDRIRAVAAGWHEARMRDEARMQDEARMRGEGRRSPVPPGVAPVRPGVDESDDESDVVVPSAVMPAPAPPIPPPAF